MDFDFLEKVLSKLRQGKIRAKVEGLLSGIAAVLITIGIGLYKDPSSGIAISLLTGGVILFLIVAYLILKGEPTDLTALKGASSFAPTPEEGELFKELGRDRMIEQLYAKVVSGNVPAILVWGLTGVGKTSLINSGLRKRLESAGYSVIYAEADRDDFEEVLLRRNRDATEKGLEAEGAAKESIKDALEHSPESLKDLIALDQTRKQVVVIDNADLIDQEKLKRWVELASQSKSYSRVLVIILDEKEFYKGWNLKGWPGSDRLEAPEVERFTRDQAIQVLRELSDKARLLMPWWFRTKIVDDIKFEKDGRISPLSLSIVFSLVGERSIGRFGLSGYRTSGGAVGLMATHLRENVTRHARSHAGDFLAAMAQQSKTDDRILSVAELSKLGVRMDAAELFSLLTILSKPDAHILRLNPDRKSFTILEDWIPALRALGAPSLEIAFIQDSVSKKLKWWREGGGPLLTREEVRQVQKYRSSLQIEDDHDLAEYISRSKAHLNKKMILLAVIVLAVSLLGWWAKRWNATATEATTEEGWGLPEDFGKYESQLSELSVACMVDDLRRLPRNLTALAANCRRIESLKGVSPRVQRLDISSTSISDLDHLPSSVTELKINWAYRIKSIEILSHMNKLTRLEAYNVPLLNMKLIPRSVVDLKLQHESIDNLEGLPDGLVNLEIIGNRASLKTLPERITNLTISKSSVPIDDLPSHLVRLETDVPILGTVPIPPHLKTFIFSTAPGNGPGAVRIPAGVRDVVLSNTRIVGELPVGLASLKFNDAISALPVEEIPGDLQRLKMQWPKGKSFDLLPKNLVELDLRRSQELDRIAGIRSVTELDISSTAVMDLVDVPDSVTTLRFESCDAIILDDFPEKLEKLYLGGCYQLDVIQNIPKTVTHLYLHGTAISSLENLPSSLKVLDISDTNISGRLPELPDGLEELILNMGQIKTLKGLPRTVTKLRFIDTFKSGASEEKDN
jgi:Leucine-rich repeat (LRR) protein/GTPase SAR1 family protein